MITRIGSRVSASSRVTRILPAFAFAFILPAACSAPANDDTGSSASEVTTQIGSVTFKTQMGGNYIGAQNNGGGAVIATATVARTWETFTLLDINGGSLVSG